MNKVALEIGRRAFLNGKSCVPAQSKECLDLLKGFTIKDNHYESMEILKSFIKGWTLENLNG